MYDSFNYLFVNDETPKLVSFFVVNMHIHDSDL